MNIKAIMNEQIVPDLPLWKFTTASMRISPSFFIIGVQKGGTSSLYKYLIEHPQILPPQRKDIYFFNNETRFEKGLKYYKGYFPLNVQCFLRKIFSGKQIFSIDGTPNYFDSPGAAKRLKAFFPEGKLILLLREPVSRAYSNYQMAVKFGFENLSFEKALELEEERIHWFEKSKYFTGHNFVYQRLAYKLRGEYIRFLPHWKELFGENLLVHFSEELESDPQVTYNSITDFLGVERFSPFFVKHNEGRYKETLAQTTRDNLAGHYSTFNSELSSFLKRELPW